MLITDYLRDKDITLACGGAVDPAFLGEDRLLASINMKCLYMPGVQLAFITGGTVAENFLISGKDFERVLYFFGYMNPNLAYIGGELRKRYGETCLPYVASGATSMYGSPWAQKLSEEMGTQPLSGILVSEFLLRFEIKSLNITGMTFFAEEGVIPYARDVHRMEPQRKRLKQILERDSRVQVDDACKEALDLPIEELNWSRDSGNLTIQVVRP